MPASPTIDGRRPSPLVAWGLLVGGVLFFAGGSMHPKQDPPGVTLKEHLRVMYEDPAWYQSHALLLAGTALIAVALVVLARSRSLAVVPRGQTVAVAVAAAATLATLATLVHLVAASEGDAIAAGQSTPIVDLQNAMETIIVPAFGFGIAALAVLGAMTGTVGNRLIAVLAVAGGIGYALAGATFLFTDRLGFLFPAASGIGLWAIAAGSWLFVRLRTRSPAARPA